MLKYLVRIIWHILIPLSGGLGACSPEGEVAFAFEELARWPVPAGVDFVDAMVLNDDRTIVWSNNGVVLSLSVKEGGRFINHELHLLPIIHAPRRDANEIEAIVRGTGELVLIDAQDSLHWFGKRCQPMIKAVSIIRMPEMYIAVTSTDRPDVYDVLLIEWRGRGCQVYSDLTISCRRPYLVPLDNEKTLVSCNAVDVPPAVVSYEKEPQDLAYRVLQLEGLAALPDERALHAFPILATSESMLRFIADLSSDTRYIQIWVDDNVSPVSMVIDEPMGVVASHPNYDLIFGMHGKDVPEFILLSWHMVK